MKVRWHTNMEAKNMQINLANTRLFRGMEPSDIEEILGCLHAKEHAFQKGEIIFPEGTATEQIGVVLSGRVIIEMGDVWGNNSVLSSVGAGGIFAEAYACVPGEPLRGIPSGTSGLRLPDASHLSAAYSRDQRGQCFHGDRLPSV